MGIVDCPKCKHKVADTMKECPFCGYNIQEAIRFNRASYMSKDYEEPLANQTKRSKAHKKMVWGFILLGFFLPMFIIGMIFFKQVGEQVNQESTNQGVYNALFIFGGLPSLIGLLLVLAASSSLKKLNREFKKGQEAYKASIEYEDKIMRIQYENDLKKGLIKKESQEDEYF